MLRVGANTFSRYEVFMSTFQKKATNTDTGDFELPPIGMHPASLVSLIDLGTHTREFQGKASDSQRIFLTWELCGEKDSKGAPFVVGQEFTWSLHKKAKLRALIKGFLGRDLEEGEDFDLASMVGAPAIITLSEGTTGSGKRFVEITGLAPPMKGFACPPPTLSPFLFGVGDLNSTLDDIPIPEWVPRTYGKTIVDVIKDSKEFGNLPNF